MARTPPEVHYKDCAWDNAGRFDDLLAVLALDPKPYWHDQQWAAKALAARGDVDGAVNLMEGLRSPYAPDMALSAVAEQLLLDAGRIDEAYARYGIQATSANTNITTFRAIAKRYPGIEPGRIIGDLIASTPGEEGKWFATAKTLKQYDLALALARRATVDPKTLVRAARDHVKNQPAFALEVALMALLSVSLQAVTFDPSIGTTDPFIVSPAFGLARVRPGRDRSLALPGA